MNGKKIIATILLTVLLTVLLVAVLFEIDIPPSTPAEIADPAVEAQYQACYQAKDDEIHATAFGTIDNPDVQKEFITTNRARAAAECRALHPEALIAVDQSPRFRLISLAPRFW